MKLRALFLAVLVGTSCADKAPPHTPESKTTKATPASAGTEAEPEPADTGSRDAADSAAVALADSPSIDLVANKNQLYLELGARQLVPMASEALRKHTNEYRRPWGKTATVDGRLGRVLSHRAGILQVPQRGATMPTTVRLLVHGLVSGQTVSLVINGKRLPGRAAPAAWTELKWQLPQGLWRVGDNTVQIFAAKKSKAAGSSAYGLYRLLSLGPDDQDISADTGSLDPAKDGALSGFSGYSGILEIPEGAFLEFSVEGAGPASVRLHDETGAMHELASGDGLSGVQRVSLAEFAGQMVWLDLRASVKHRWVAPRIALPKAALRDAPRADNVILLVIDALRSDRLRHYNPKTRVETPHMTKHTDSGGVVFKNNQAASPSSPPSHGSIQTGMIPRVHGVAGDGGKLKPGTPMLSTQAVAAGLSAAYYGNNPFGMARLEGPGKWTEFHQPGREGKGLDCVPLIDGILDFAGRQKVAGKRFVISSLPYEPHTPYRFHEGITTKYYSGSYGAPVGKSVDGHLLGALSSGAVTLNAEQWKQLFALYDGEVEYMDQCYGRLLDGLEKAGLGKNTAILITSDHGEGMFEHGKMGHAFGHYRELGDVPLTVLVPNYLSEDLVLGTVSSHLDIVPTILDLLGVEKSKEIQGRSLVPLMRRQGAWTPRVVSLEYGRSYSLRSARWKFIVDYQGKQSLFDLREDPGETINIVDKNHTATRYMRGIAGFFLQHRSQWKAESWGDLNNHSPEFSKDNP